MYASQKARKLGIVSSIVAIVVCIVLITGSTFSLFTGSTDSDITISAGQITLNADIENLALSSLGVNMAGTTFANGGSAELNDAKLDLYNVTPGDRVEFDIVVYNTSSVSISYAITWAYSGDLASYLDFYIDGTKFTSGSLTSDWNEWLLEDVAEPVTHKIAVELPKDVDNTAFGLTAAIAFDLAAVQYNAIDDTVESADQLELAIKNFDSASLASSFEITDGRTIEIPAGKTFTLDLNGYTVYSDSTNPVILNNGNLTVIGGSLVYARSAAVATSGSVTHEGTRAVVNNGTLTVNGGNFTAIENAGTATLTDVSADSIKNTKKLTVSDSTVSGAVENSGSGNITITNSTAGSINNSYKITVTNSTVVGAIESNSTQTNNITGSKVGSINNAGKMNVKTSEVADAIENSGTLTVEGTTAASLSNSGTATVTSITADTIGNTGSMTIANATTSFVSNTDDGNLVIDNITATTTEGNAVYHSGASLVIYNGSFQGADGDALIKAESDGLVINGGSFSSEGTVISGAIEINKGTFEGEIDDTAAAPTINNGTFTDEDAKNYVPDSYDQVENDDGTVTLRKPVATIGSVTYYDIDEAVAAWTNNSTLTLISDVTLSDVVKLKSTEHHILNLGTYTLTAAKSQHAIEITCDGRSSASYALTINADAENPGGITATGKSCIYYKKSGSTKDRPIIVINNGVFNGSYSINSTSNGNTNCPQFWINGGTFNSYINLTKNMLKVSGGTFNCSINCTGDQNAYRQFSGGRFQSWQFMTADASNKFAVTTNFQKDGTGAWIGTYDVGMYVDEEGYLVIGGAVITEAGDKFALSGDYSVWSSYLKYSSAKDNGLYFVSAEQALAKYTSKNFTVYTDEIDLTGINYTGTLTISDTLTITFANGATVAWTVVDANGAAASYTDVITDGVVTRTYTVA